MKRVIPFQTVVEAVSKLCGDAAVKLPADVLDDMELVEIMAGKYPGEAFRVAATLNHLLGDQKKALYDHLRKIHGKVPASAVEVELAEIFEALGEAGKNS